MPFDGLFLHHLINELSPQLIGARIEKIGFNEPNQIILNTYLNGVKSQLIIDLMPQLNRVFLDSNQPYKTSNGSWLVQFKRILESSRIIKLSQHGSDRVMIIQVSKQDLLEGEIIYDLIVELMGKHANCILVDDHHVIIESYKKIVSIDQRTIMPKHAFTFFPSNKKSFFDLDFMPQTKDEWMTTYEGISPDLAYYLAVHQSTPLSLKMSPIQSHQKFFCSSIYDNVTKQYDTLSNLMKHQTIELPIQINIKELDLRLSKLQTKINHLEDDLQDATSSIQLKELADRMLLEADLNRKMIQFEDHVFAQSKSISAHIQDLYQVYKKNKRKVAYIEAQLNSLHLEKSNLSQLKFDFEQGNTTQEHMKEFLKSSTPNQHKKSTLPEKINYHEIKQERYTIFYGKNSRQNAIVTHEIAKKDDYIFHVKDAPGAHVCYRGRIDDHEGKQLAAKIAAYHSSYRHSHSIPVSFTQKKYIKKVKGQPLSTILMMQYETFFIDLDENFVKWWENK